MLKTPLWTDQFPRPNNLATSHNPSSDTDIAIIGSGYTGLCAARILRKNGASVTIFERNTIFDPLYIPLFYIPFFYAPSSTLKIFA